MNDVVKRLHEFRGPPYLSVVATSRNDDHGGDLLTRMQVFVSALTSQVVRHGVPSELVLVEWNPPADRSRLADALTWPDDQGWCPIRIITVPETLHRRLMHSNQLSLFQMIAKNVGIRCALGRFVLATNVDILFSDSLMGFLRQRTLLPGHLYRSDRIDIDRGVEVQWPVDKQLEYCRTHVLRANRPDGIQFAPADGKPHTVEDATLTEEEFLRHVGSQNARLDLAFSLRRKLRRTRFGRIISRLPLQRMTRERWGTPFAGDRGNRTARGRRHVLFPDGPVPGHPTRGNLSLTRMFTKMLWPFIPLPDLHVLASGDFTLMARDTWHDIGGNPELEMFSLHLDSLTMYNAHAHGLREVRLPPNMMHYHMEHDADWASGRQGDLYERLRTLGIPFVSQGLLARLAHQLLSGTRLRLSGPEWGLANCILEETRISRGRVHGTSCTMGARA